MARKVHQSAHFLQQAPLRLAVSVCLDDTLVSLSPSGWVIGSSKNLGMQHSLYRLRTNIVNA